MLRRGVRVAVGGLALALSSCEWFTDPLCDICTSSVQIQGVVTANGVPVSGASIRAAAGLHGSCEAIYMSDLPEDVTSADGSYDFRFYSPAAPGEHCVVLHVNTPPAAGLAARIDTLLAVRFRADFGGTGQRDTVTYNFALVPVP
jgi:hypothetical protein